MYLFLQQYYEIKAKKIPLVNLQIIILYLLYINDLLLLLTLTLVAKSFSSSYKELSSATSNNSRGLNERREQQKTPSPRFCRCFRLFVCVDNNNNKQQLRQTMTYHVILSSTIVFAADDRYSNSK
jgi:hypothetical protein